MKHTKKTCLHPEEYLKRKRDELNLVYWECQFCGKEVTSTRRRLINAWVKYRTWKGRGNSWTSWIKGITNTFIFGGVTLSTAKVMWDITLPWEIFPIIWLVQEIFEIWLGHEDIYKWGVQGAEAYYVARTKEINPVMNQISEDIKKIKEKLNGQ